ncbi:GspE/PulE family protein [Roseisolibacter agri]|uniref:GspE/PulE family protein n=1 Tax=Roseisolibacter agri TaxID=2014610 RepID=UPI0024E12F91|nr:GspE/PulE family protein [Roseisolibacter agri]
MEHAPEASDAAAELRAAAAGAMARELPSAWLEAHLVLPLGLAEDGALRVAAGGQPDATVVDALARRFARPVRLVPVPPQDLRAAVLAAARETTTVTADANDLLVGEETSDLRALADEAPVVTVVDALLRDALRLGASDVHLESAADGVRVRFRLDGVLRDVERVAPALRAGVVSRVKVLAGLDVAERRRPQDGRARLRVAGADGAPREVDLRVATLPALHGESVVLRILDHGGGGGARDLQALGMPEPVRARFERLLARTTGLVLVTGPTGSGKTTSLYAALARVATPGVKVVTVEDPVEYRMPGVVQVAVQPAVGLTFASALRAILRHDPDVVLVGEMRDRETAETAVQAALTGHLVFSTLHTTDAVGGVARLADMGVERFLIAATVQGIVAQRLVRVLCDACAQPADPDASPLATLATLEALAGEAIDDATPRWRRAVGCAACAHTGFRGRTGIYELLTVSEAMRALIAAGAPQDALRAQARRDGLVPLAADGLRLARAGRTTLDEVLRVAHLDDAA